MDAMHVIIAQWQFLYNPKTHNKLVDLMCLHMNVTSTSNKQYELDCNLVLL